MARARPSQRGFTLLEVMCAFAILVGVTQIVVTAWRQSMEVVGDTISRRELREAADACFRRILFEQHKHEDGMRENLENFYAEWAGIRPPHDEEWNVYELRLEKKEKVAAGSAADDDAESLFGENDERRAPIGRDDEDEEGDVAPIKVTEYVMEVYYVDDPGDDPLITLSTLVRSLDVVEPR